MKEQESRLIYAFPRGQDEEVQIAVRKYKSRYYMDLRVWFKAKGEDALYPSKKGISIALDQLPELRKGMDRLSKASENLRQDAEVEV